ncbi:ParB/RepB/Spo0J family partition protein [Candidatus Uhrbacteria bacterium]|nr:ParB/RepB/Spo0J family partition protein [Candidatus Uhrbacteria bacterium]
MSPSTLGRGLDALLTRKKKSSLGEHTVSTPRSAMEISIHSIDLGSNQPRQDFDQESLQGLADSIRQYGILQPLIVAKAGDRYELIAGERRLRAAKLAGISHVPVVLRDADTNTKIAIALIENIQRVDLNPIELAIAYTRLKDELGLTQDEIAVRMGKKRPTITNSLRLLTLPEPIQEAIRDGRLGKEVGKIILTLGSAKEQLAFFHTALEKKFTTQAAESFLSTSSAVRPHIRKARDTSQISKEEELRAQFGTKVSIRKSKGRGMITISFYSEDEYRTLLQRLLEA